MSLPAAQLAVLVEIMSATMPDCPEPGSVTYDPEEGVYHGLTPSLGIRKLEDVGFIELVAEHGAAAELGSSVSVVLNRRDDVLASWEAGVKAFFNGQDLHYADYNSIPGAFSAAWHYAGKRQKKRARPYDYSQGYVCHGFPCAHDSDPDFIYKQH